MFGGYLAGKILIAIGWSLVLGRSPLGAPGGWLASLGVVVIAVLTHELTHFLLMPSGNKVFGLWPARAMAYVHRPGDLSDLSRTRVLAIMLGPFVLISVLPLMLAALGVEVNAWIIWVSIWNTLGSSFDLQMAVGVLRRK